MLTADSLVQVGVSFGLWLSNGGCSDSWLGSVASGVNVLRCSGSVDRPCLSLTVLSARGQLGYLELACAVCLLVY